MPAKFNTFNTGSVNMTDYVVGYSTATSGGERRWTIQQIADSVAGVQTLGSQIQTSQNVIRYLANRQGTNPSVIWTDSPLVHQLKVKTTNPYVRIQAMISTASSNGNHPAMFRIIRKIVSGGSLTESVVQNGQGTVESGKDYTACTSSANGYTSGNGYQPGVPCYIDVIDNQLNAPVGTAVKYTIQWWLWHTSNWAYMNYAWTNPGGTGNPYIGRTISSITLTEIAS